MQELPIAVEVSIGIGIYPDHGSNADSLIQRADVAMYAAKENGRGYLSYSSDLDRHSPRRLALMGELRQAIEKNQLCLYFQPKIEFNTNQVSGTEALVRWQHPEHGFIPPDQFISPAEQTGLITPLTQWVLQETMRKCCSLYEGGNKLKVASNLSVRNLQDPQLPTWVDSALEKFNFQPGYLELEITESAIMVNPTNALKVLSQLSDMGIGLCIDDFGTGYSSLGYLKKLPVGTIKIDKSFVIGMKDNENDQIIVRSIIDLGHNLGLKVVAEGVENEWTWNRLDELGCDSAQGYYMSRPLPLEDLKVWFVESPWGIKKCEKNEMTK
jgi:EAL domain-containing protein (putative c-di-GMP-specific phosphodiesterase class I)